MDRLLARWGRLALLASIVAVAIALAAPVMAYAHSTTRIVVYSGSTVVSSKSLTVDWSKPGIVPTAPVVTAKLQKKSGTRWVSLKGTIRMYVTDTARPTYVWLSTKTGSSSMTRSLAVRGRYKFEYRGSSTTKPCKGYVNRLDYIGDTLELTSRDVEEIDDTWTRVVLQYRVGWNTEAYTGAVTSDPLEFDYSGTFEGADNVSISGRTTFAQELRHPGIVELTYLVRTSEIPVGTFRTVAQVLSDDSYVVTTSELFGELAYPLPR